MRLLNTTADSGLSQAVKDNTARIHHFNLARVAIAKKDLTVAKTEIVTHRDELNRRQQGQSCEDYQDDSQNRFPSVHGTYYVVIELGTLNPGVFFPSEHDEYPTDRPSCCRPNHSSCVSLLAHKADVLDRP